GVLIAGISNPVGLSKFDGGESNFTELFGKSICENITKEDRTNARKKKFLYIQINFLQKRITTTAPKLMFSALQNVA
ncbi:MAG TPA: hypothetical protein VFM72_08875, partial [Aequorivita sp.]|nr:hypothetical protein [Aequorivita sp.]